MAEQAIVFIPDISGFTDFTSTTAIDHAAHIITELLELLVESNQSGFTLAEIEGDAVLFLPDRRTARATAASSSNASPCSRISTSG